MYGSPQYNSLCQHNPPSDLSGAALGSIRKPCGFTKESDEKRKLGSREQPPVFPPSPPDFSGNIYTLVVIYCIGTQSGRNIAGRPFSKNMHCSRENSVHPAIDIIAMGADNSGGTDSTAAECRISFHLLARGSSTVSTAGDWVGIKPAGPPISSGEKPVEFIPEYFRIFSERAIFSFV